MAGIKAARSGARLGDISAAIQNYVETRGFSVVREYSGHGVGQEICMRTHWCQILARLVRALCCRKGMTLALEPMVNAGDWRTRLLRISGRC